MPDIHGLRLSAACTGSWSNTRGVSRLARVRERCNVAGHDRARICPVRYAYEAADYNSPRHCPRARAGRNPDNDTNRPSRHSYGGGKVRHFHRFSKQIHGENRVHARTGGRPVGLVEMGKYRVRGRLDLGIVLGKKIARSLS